MKKKRLLLPLAIAITSPIAVTVSAQQATGSTDARPARATAQPGSAYLGVGVGPVPAPVQAQLPAEVEKNQGLMVLKIMPGSPAAKGGIEIHDVLLSYDGTKLYKLRDLITAVNAGKPGDKATLELVRNGKLTTLEITLASKASRFERRPHGYGPMMGGPKRGGQVESRVWQSFQSMSVNKGPDGRYRAMVEFLDPQGNSKRFEYDGSREEIREQVKKEKELPDGLKRQLLQSLSDQSAGYPQQMFPVFPDIQREFFSPPPWFRQQRPSFWE